MLDLLTLHRYATLALQEDLASGDVTTDSTIGPDVVVTASAIAKQPLVVCGGPLFETCFVCLDPTARVQQLVAEGERVERNTRLWSVTGNARAILKAERSALNYAQRLSGISSLTRRFVEALPANTRTRITDTRKTTPGLRPLERYAVRVGGGRNHRDSLGTAVLIKDNHIQAAGGIHEAVAAARLHAPHTSKIELEVENLSMLDLGLDAGADVIMLDNFDPAQIAEAVRRCSGRALVEVSGGITLDKVPLLAQSGVDIISVGALTHSAPAADISLRFTGCP